VLGYSDKTIHMRTFLLLSLFISALTFLAFKFQKCDHVFTRVEQANVKIEPFSISLGSSGYASGLKEGNELICVKCFHMQKQMLDYGKLDLFPPMSSYDCITSGDSLSLGTLSVRRAGGLNHPIIDTAISSWILREIINDTIRSKYKKPIASTMSF
jgi:hypothetical protein